MLSSFDLPLDTSFSAGAVWTRVQITTQSSAVRILSDYCTRPGATNYCVSPNPGWSFVTTAPTPVADAGGSVFVHAGVPVTLDGTGSYDDATASEDLLYRWKVSTGPNGSTPSLTGANTATPTITPDASGGYAVVLVVEDEDGLLGADFANVNSQNAIPIPVISPAVTNAALGSVVTFDSRSSTDADGDPIISSSWRITAPDGSVDNQTGEELDVLFDQLGSWSMP